MAGWDAAYRTDYPTARARFEQLRKLYPQHPSGHLALASIVWQEYLFRERRLQSGLYRRDSRFYSGARKTAEKNEGDPIDPQLDAAFQRHINDALTTAQARVNVAPRDPEALYFLGAVYGVRAAYAASAQRKFWTAFRDGMKSVKLHNRVLEIDPAFHDALLTLGTYHYVVGSVPLAFRAVATLAGIRGDRLRGIAELEQVAAKGRYNQDDARALLVALYRYENRPADALHTLTQYSRRYPENALIRIEIASTLAQLDRYAEAGAAFDLLLETNALADLVHYQYAEALALEKDHRKAASHFLASAAVSQSLAPAAFFRAGNMFDLAGLRPQALDAYNRSLSSKPPPTLRDAARRFLSRPYSGG